jgi:multidrug efflux pump subunit AcrA (membrane-fusion protein)
MPVQVRVEGQPRPLEAKVARIAPAAEPGTRSIGVTVVLDNADERLRAGQYAMVRVALADDTQRLTLPGSAIGRTGGQAHVWTLTDGRLIRRAITLGRSDALTGRVEVLTGLPEDARVLGARFDGLREGAKAELLSAGEPGRTASAASAAIPTAATH